MGLQDVQFSYNISRLMALDRQRDAMFQARLYADEYLANTGERLAIRPYLCGNVCCCCSRCGCVEVGSLAARAGPARRVSRLGLNTAIQHVEWIMQKSSSQKRCHWILGWRCSDWRAFDFA